MLEFSGSPSCATESKAGTVVYRSRDGKKNRPISPNTARKVPRDFATGATSQSLPLSGGDPETVFARIRKSRGAATAITAPANSSVDLSGITTEELLAAFDRTEKSLRVLAEFFGAVDKFSDRGVNPRRAFADTPGERERFRVLTVSAVKIYQALAAEPLGRCAGERVLGVRFADLGEAIVVALEVLDYAGARHG